MNRTELHNILQRYLDRERERKIEMEKIERKRGDFPLISRKISLTAKLIGPESITRKSYPLYNKSKMSRL